MISVIAIISPRARETECSKLRSVHKSNVSNTLEIDVVCFKFLFCKDILNFFYK